MASVTRYGQRANLPLSGLVVGELLFTLDRGALYSATGESTAVPVVPAVDELAALVGSGVVSTQDYVLIHDSDAPGVKEKKILVGELLVAMGAVPAGQLGQPNGVATLGSDGKVPASQLPDAVLGALKYQGTWNASTNSPAIPAASSSNRGFYYVVAAAGATSLDGEADWQVGDWLVSSGSSWGKVDNSDKVSSVAGKTGAVTLVKGDVGLGNVDNTSDANKPVSTAQQAALDGKEPSIAAGTTAKYWRGDKTWQDLNKTTVGLGNVDNTSDANKPVSTAQQAALDAKMDKAGGTFTGDIAIASSGATRTLYLGPTGYYASVSYNSNGNLDITARSGYRINLNSPLTMSNQNTAATATAGGNSLPSNPAGFLTVVLHGTTVKIPYYNN